MGVLAPIAVVPPLIWIMVFIIICSRYHEGNSFENTLSNRSILLLSICAVLNSLVFSVAWIFGFEATSSTARNSTTRTALMIVFIILSALQGLLLLIILCIKKFTDNRRTTSHKKDDETIPFIQDTEEPASPTDKPPQITPLISSSGRQPSKKRMNVLPASTVTKSTVEEQIKPKTKRMEVITNTPAFKLVEESTDDDGDDFSDDD